MEVRNMGRKFASATLAFGCLLAGCGVTAPSAAPPSPTGNPDARPSPTAAASPAPSRTAPTTSSLGPSAPPLTQTFTSGQHGISVSYPEGWIVRAATEPWTDRPGEPQFVHPGFDVLRDPVLDDHLFIDIISRPIGDATPEAWAAEQLTGDDCAPAKPIVVDGANGLIGVKDCDLVAVAIASRGYLIELATSNDDPSAVAPYDRAWFEEVLATVQLQPEDAVDVVPSAAP
jgi:hypothetical protein